MHTSFMADPVCNNTSAQLPRFNVLDSWRGVCACMVALLHFMANSHIYPIPVIKSAGLFVDFFFVLSGFVIFANYEERLRKGYGALKFMFLRFGRLYPLHFVTFLAFIAVDLLQMALPSLQNYAQFSPFSAPGETPSDIISNLFLLHAVDLEKAKGFNAPSWSISAEFYTYAVFAAAILLFRNKIYIFCAFMLVITPLLLTAIMLEAKEFSYISGFLRCLCGFSAGAFCWLIWKTYHDKIKSVTLPTWFWHALEIAILVAVYFFVSSTGGTPFRYAAGLFFGFTLLIFTFERGLVSKALLHPFFRLLGVLSYSIYMVHMFVASKITPIVAKMVEKFFDIPIFTMVDGREKIGVELWHGDLMSLIYMIVVIAVSWVSYKLIEDPGRRLSRYLVHRKIDNAAHGSTSNI